MVCSNKTSTLTEGRLVLEQIGLPRHDKASREQDRTEQTLRLVEAYRSLGEVVAANTSAALALLLVVSLHKQLNQTASVVSSRFRSANR